MSGLMVNRVHYPVITLGPGVRAGIWTQGCSIGCRGCSSHDTWAPEPARIVPVGEIVRWLDGLPRVDGVTITGGEPFDQPEGLAELLTGIRAWRSGTPAEVDVLVYSGYPLGVLRRRAAAAEPLGLADAVVTGPYVERLNPGGRWRGSSNQRLVPLTDLGNGRYGGEQATPWAEHEQRLQVASDGRRLWLIGLPARGDLHRLEQDLTDRGIDVTEASWRV